VDRRRHQPRRGAGRFVDDVAGQLLTLELRRLHIDPKHFLDLKLEGIHY
jgi:hypothetical protein